MTFILSKILWSLFSPLHLLVFLLLFGVWGIYSERAVLKRWAGRVLSFCVFFLFLLMIFPLGDWAMVPLERAFVASTPQSVDGIIVLAGDERPDVTHARGLPSLGDTAERYIVFAQLARDYPDVPLFFVGGSPSLHREAETVSFADIARKTFLRLGLDANRLHYEELSRNTYENATMAAQMMKPTKAQNWLLVTSAYHMPRSVLCFEKAGWRVTPYPMDFKTTGQVAVIPKMALLRQMSLLSIAMREYIGLVAYRLMGRIDTVWPS